VGVNRKAAVTLAISLTSARAGPRRPGIDARRKADRAPRAPRPGARVLALLALVASGPGCGLFGPPPDVFVVTLDGARIERFGAYGAAESATPALDTFAADAASFTYAWSTSCAPVPALASALTGRYPTAHGAATPDARVPDSVVTLTELLAERGYEAAAFRSGPAIPPASGVLRGYATHTVLDAAALTHAALDWLATIPRGRAVHALLAYGDVPARVWEGAPPAAVAAAEPGSSAVVAAADRYAASLRFVDEQVGRLLDGLRAAGRYDDALIIVAGTSGETLGEHRLAGHGLTLYEEATRIPLLVRYPGGVSAGSVVETPASLVDLLVVVADEVGVAPPADLESVRIGERDVVFAECARDPAAIASFGSRVDRDLFAAIRWPWKMVVSDRDPPELYNLASPRREGRNEFGTARGVAADLMRTVNRLQMGLRPPG